MDYDTLTFDTQVVETNGFHFDGGLLAQLKQFAKAPIEIVVSQIVAAEIARHLRDHIHTAKADVERAHKDAVRYGLKSATDKAFEQLPDPPALARKRLEDYLSAINATVLRPDELAMRDLVQAYFRSAPPFASAGKKKHEFPDAIALLSLEQWAKANKKRILAVSGDRDWAAFAEKSDAIDVVPQLSDALELLQKYADEAEVIVQRLLTEVESGANAALSAQFEEMLSDAVSGDDVGAEGSSAYSFETEEVEVTLEHYEFDRDQGALEVQIVQAGRTVVTAEIGLRVLVTAQASFSLATYDSIDKDYVGLGTTTVRKDHEECDIRILVTFEGDFATDDIALTKVELIDGIGEINFGEIEIDYGDPDEKEPWGDTEGLDDAIVVAEDSGAPSVHQEPSARPPLKD
ncbi:MAG: PIN domain-containing protein [Rhizomicrobium sp.]